MMKIIDRRRASYFGLIRLYDQLLQCPVGLLFKELEDDILQFPTVSPGSFNLGTLCRGYLLLVLMQRWHRIPR